VETLATVSDVQTLKNKKTVKLKLAKGKNYKVKYTKKYSSKTGKLAFALYVNGSKKLYLNTSKDKAVSVLVQAIKINTKTTVLFVNLGWYDAWSVSNIVLKYSKGKLTSIGDIGKITFQGYQKAKIAKSGKITIANKNTVDKTASKIVDPSNSPKVVSASAGVFKVRFSQPHLKSIGLSSVYVSYKLKSGKVARTSLTYPIKMNYPDSSWVGNTGPLNTTLTTYTEAGGTTPSFTAVSGDRLTVNNLHVDSGKTYIQVTNAGGQTGWFKDFAVNYTPIFKDAFNAS
jgi:hypothetical protein